MRRRGSPRPRSRGARGEAPSARGAAALPGELEGAFLAGAERFDAGAYFEAHELWEELWRAAARDPEAELRARRLKGLIQLAAALLKHREGRPRPAASLLDRACRLLEAGPDRVLGVSGRALAARAREHLAEGAPAPRIGSTPPSGTARPRP